MKLYSFVKLTDRHSCVMTSSDNLGSNCDMTFLQLHFISTSNEPYIEVQFIILFNVGCNLCPHIYFLKWLVEESNHQLLLQLLSNQWKTYLLGDLVS